MSLILRNKTIFASDTRERVLSVARKLKYRPNLLVKGMQSGKTYTVGVIMPMVTAYRSEILTGIHNELVAADHIPFIVWPNPKAKQPYRFTELEQIHRLVDRRVDGVILFPQEDQAPDDYLHEVWERKIPLVSVDREMEATHADFVGVDDSAGARMVAEHLLSLGHTNFGYLSGIPSTTTTFRHRLESFKSAVSQKTGSTLVIAETDYVKVKIKPVLELLKSVSRPTAIFAANDYLAIAVLRAAEMLGLKVPEDISVVGFGDLDVCVWVSPRLTSVQQFPRLIGREAAKLILKRSFDSLERVEPRKIRIRPKLVIRESTARVSK